MIETTEKPVRSFLPYLGSLEHDRYQQMCNENDGEEGLWRLYAEEFKRQLHITGSHQLASKRTSEAMAGRFGIQVRESAHVHTHLRNTYSK